jgi:hypothetical protein
MKRKDAGLDFEAVIGADGKISVPGEIISRLGTHTGSPLRVRLLPEVLARALERNNVTAGEVEKIAAVQLEDREQVIAFLLAEGTLAPGRRSRRTVKGRAK